MLKIGHNAKVKRNPANMLRVVFTSSECGEVVKHYNVKGIGDVRMMRGFQIKSWQVVPAVRYSK